MQQENLPRTFYRVLRLHQMVASHVESAVQPAGLTAHQYTVLSLIRRYAPVSSAEVARKLLVSAQSAGESIKTLEARRLLIRSAIPDNRRTHALSLTPEGAKTLSLADSLILNAEDKFFMHLSIKERELFEQLIQRLRHQES